MASNPDDCGDLLQIHFPGLLSDCGEEDEPGLVIEDEWRNWTGRPTTPDQLAIEQYLARQDLEGCRILHVGIGNSSLALRFHAEAKGIVGLSMDPEEIDLARQIALPNYDAGLHNKFTVDTGAFEGPFDYIIDYNRTTFACYLKHFASMMQFYARHLAHAGQLHTERVGLGWIVNPAVHHKRWSFDIADLAAASAPFGLKVYRQGTVYIVAKDRPANLARTDRRRKLRQRIRSWLLPGASLRLAADLRERDRNRQRRAWGKAAIPSPS